MFFRNFARLTNYFAAKSKVQEIKIYFWVVQYNGQLLLTTRLSATKVTQIYSSQGNYLQLS